MAELSAEMSRRTITATIDGMSETYENGRTFHWYLDGELVETQSTMDKEGSRSYTFKSVPYKAQHIVELYVNDYDDEEAFGEFATTVNDTMFLWSWVASNGSATREQTQTAYAAAASKGMTASFSRFVWNDLVELLASTVSMWNPKYTETDDTLMAMPYEDLTADRFNSVVHNIGNPWMFWNYKTDREGYLGRLTVRGVKDSGESADTVYGEYLIELAKKLNVLIDAEGEFGAGYAKLMGHEDAKGLRTYEYLPLRAPFSRRASHDAALRLVRNFPILFAPTSRYLTRIGRLWTVPYVTLSPDEAKHLTTRIRSRTGRDFSLAIDNHRPLYVDAQLASTPLAALQNAVACVIRVAVASLTDPDIALSPTGTKNLAASILSATTPNVALSVTEASAFAVELAIPSVLLADLLSIASTPLEIAATHATAPDALLTTPTVAKLLLSGAAHLTDTLTMSTLQAKSAWHTGRISAAEPSVQMAALTAARMIYTSDDTLGAVLDAVLRTPLPARLQHEIAENLAAVLDATMRTPPPLHLNHETGVALRTLLDATLRTPLPARMLLDALEKDAKTGIITLSDTPSLDMGVNILETFRDVLDVALAAQPSVYIPEVTAASTSTANGTLEPQLTEPMTHASETAVTGDATMISPNGASSGMDGVYVTAFAAVMELDGVVDVEWVTKDGANLYIRGAWDAWNDGDNLQIDTTEFYAPVRDGSNLHIRSVWRSYQDDTEANIDLDVFYKPVRTGSNLYIKSDIFGGE